MFARVHRGSLFTCFALLSFGLLAACADDVATLEVRAVTALVAGPEFRVAETSIYAERGAGSQATIVGNAEAIALFGNDYSRGRQVSSFSLPLGEYRVRVRLRRPNGALLIERTIVLDLAADTVLPVHLTRDCVDVECPAPGGSPAFTTCLAGRCVDPRCSTLDTEYCPAVAFCEAPTDCGPTSSCAEPGCDEGVCIPNPIDGACTDVEWCNSDPGAGCEELVPPNESGVVCGSICTEANKPCEFGYWHCTPDREPFCDTLLNRPFDFACAEGRFCDALGECVDRMVATPGFLVVPTAGLTTSESGTQSTFTVALATAPTASVFLTLDSDNASEGTVSPRTLAFTTTNWASPQTVTVQGVDDAVTDGNQLYHVVTAPAVSADTYYDNQDASDVVVTNLDDETPGFIATAVLPATVSEGGSTAAFQLRLQAEPTSPVSIAIESSDTTEGTVSPSMLTFTPINWNAPQTIAVLGVDDSVLDGDQPFLIRLLPAASDDSRYDGLDPEDVSIVNVDDESPGVTLSRTSGLVTSEAGGTATFSVSLNTMPASDVTIAIASSDASEAMVSPTVLTFTSGNFAAAQLVTVTGVDDVSADGDQPFTIMTGATASANSTYAGLAVTDITGTNQDDDVAAIDVAPTSSLTTTESGVTAVFTLVLRSAPTADVSIPIASGDVTEGSVPPAPVVFTPTDWNTPRSVTVTGVDDAVADGNQLYSVHVGAAASSDPAYDGLVGADVLLSNTDDESAQVNVSPLSGHVTSESGATSTFTVVLGSAPTSSVTLAVSSTDSAEGTVDLGSLTFTSSDWDMPRTVTITGADDATVDGDQSFSVRVHVSSTTDASYSALADQYVSCTNTDNEVAGVTVTPTTGLVTTEAGGSASFQIVLNAQPVANVSVALSTSDATEGTVSVASLIFTSANWNTPQTVSVTGVDDAMFDGNILYTIVTGATVSSSAEYNGLSVSDVSVSNTDNDAPQIVVTPTSGLVTSEAGVTASFQIVLSGACTSDVTFTLGSSRIGEGTVNPTSATFTTGNWNVPQTFVVTGVNDNIIDGNALYTIVTSSATSADVNYSGYNVPDVSVTNQSSLTQTAYVKASNTNADDRFGSMVAISGDGSTMAVSSPREASNATGINGDQTNNSMALAGAVYVFRRVGMSWALEAYVKASNTGAGDYFSNVALSADGNTLAVGAYYEQSNATGINGNQADNSMSGAGAVYVFTRTGVVWSQQAYIKASNTNGSDNFSACKVSADGNTLVVSAPGEASNATGINGNQANNSLFIAGAVYVFTRSGTVWTQQAYIKASNTNSGDWFAAAALSGDGDTLAVSASSEDSAATGINGNQADNTAADSGAVYVFRRLAGVWSQEAYVKASNTEASDFFSTLAISYDGSTLAVGAILEDSGSPGVNANQADNSAPASGAVYMFTRVAGVWSQQAYIKSVNPGPSDNFGQLLDISADGDVLVASAYQEDSGATGLFGNEFSETANGSGAVYSFHRIGGTWTYEAYIKASNAGASDAFGNSLALSADGATLIVAAPFESSSATGIDGNQSDNSASNSGAVYTFYGG